MILNWAALYEDDSKLPRTLFFHENLFKYFRYGLNAQNQRCLFFHVPAITTNLPVIPVLLSNIGLEEQLYEGQETLILYLLNEDFRNQFDDLITDIVNETKKTPEKELKQTFISLCNKWFEFLQPASKKLSDQDLKGLFAELEFLKYLLISSPYPCNEILESWKGPFGKAHDFELGENHFEIKGIDTYNETVHISSEYQLDFLKGQSVVLVIYKFSDSKDSGNVSLLITDIIEILRKQTGVKMGLFWRALHKAGIDFSTLDLYQTPVFYVSQIEYYKVSVLEFPSIIRSNLPDSIRSVRYELALNEILNFKISNIKFNYDA